MTLLAGLLVVALVGEWLLQRFADGLNVRALASAPPAGLESIYDPQAYARSQDYTRVRTYFNGVVSTLDLGLLLGFWAWGGFDKLDLWVDHPSALVTGLLYFAVLFLAHSVLMIPFQLYSTFVIEERFGFNRMTLKTFILDKLKGLLLTVALGGPLLAGVLALLQSLGPRAWWMGWAAVTVFSLFVQFIAPTWILPLFNKFTPLAEGELRRSIFEFAQKNNFPLSNLFVMDGSKRSGKSNAFFTGFGKNKRIALFDTLIEKHTVPELVAILAHEIGHYKLKHVLKGAVLQILQTGIVFYFLSLALTWPSLYDAFGVRAPSVHVGLVIFGVLYGPVSTVLSWPLLALSRHHEFSADHYAAKTTGSQKPLADGLKKLAAHNLSNLTPHPMTVFLHHTHPPLADRLRALEGSPSLRERAIR